MLLLGQFFCSVCLQPVTFGLLPGAALCAIGLPLAMSRCCRAGGR